MSASLAFMAGVLGGDVVGHQVLCPGPRHSPKDRSLSVCLSAGAPEGFVVHSHAGDDRLECRDFVREKMGWDRPRRFGQRDPAAAVARQPATQPDETAKIERARAIWQSAIEPRGTVVERYLASRGLTLPWQVANEAIRYHPACPWREPGGQTVRVPAMIGALRSMKDEEITGVHRTRLTLDGQKVDRRMLGRASGSAIMLASWASLGGGVAIAEGIETALAGWQMGWSHVWALGSVGAIASFPLFAGFTALTIMAETGDGGASQRAVEAVGSRWIAAGHEVIIVAPATGGDLNDAIRQGAS